MPIQFHDEKNKYAYAGRRADTGWMSLISQKAAISGAIAADVGCGGGVYCAALAELGAAQVIGVDFSEAMLTGATEHCAAYAQIRFTQGTAAQTGLPDRYVDIVLERALIHHLAKNELAEALTEAHRILKRGGMLIIQDRTPEDCLLPGSREHMRGCLFERFPRLIPLETNRRHDSNGVMRALSDAGFEQIEEVRLWETRKRYESFAAYREELLQRTGRSILHEITNEELRELADAIADKLGLQPQQPVEERDRWTIWLAGSK